MTHKTLVSARRRCSQVVTTVGYGDFVPTHDGSKLFTVFYIYFALVPAARAKTGHKESLSPFATFKKIVSLPEAEREVAVGKLKISSERHRKLVHAKILEYAAMPEAERDRKLDALDFRWHLMPIMKTEKTDRAKRLASVPERFRTDIKRRLTGWDQLDASVRADLLKNESFFRYLSSFGRGYQSRVALTNHMEKMSTRLREGLRLRFGLHLRTRKV